MAMQAHGSQVRVSGFTAFGSTCLKERVLKGYRVSAPQSARYRLRQNVLLNRHASGGGATGAPADSRLLPSPTLRRQKPLGMQSQPRFALHVPRLHRCRNWRCKSAGAPRIANGETRKVHSHCQKACLFQTAWSNLQYKAKVPKFVLKDLNVELY